MIISKIHILIQLSKEGIFHLKYIIYYRKGRRSVIIKIESAKKWSERVKETRKIILEEISEKESHFS